MQNLFTGRRMILFVPLCANIDEESTKSTQIIPSLVQIGPDFKKTCNIY